MLLILFVFLAVFHLSTLSNWALVRYLPKFKALALPNERSNHKIPTPVGAGLAVNISLLLGALLFGHYCYNLETEILIILFFAAISSAIFFIDDLIGLPILYRLIIQLIMVVTAVSLLPDDLLLFGGHVSYILDRSIASFLLLGFINSYNFMDGIDGITASQTFQIAICLILFTIFYPLSGLYFKEIGLLIIAATLGFLIFNWQPAKIFLGDAGSVPLGLVLGWLLLSLAIHGYWPAAIIIPSYYLADSSITMFLRLIAGKKIWQAHSEHFYQIAARRRHSHSLVVKQIILTNIVLCVLAILSVKFYPLVMISLAIITNIITLQVMKKY